MFSSNTSLNDVSIASCWKKESVLASTSCQTSPIETTHTAVETTRSCSIQIQTDSEPISKSKLNSTKLDLPSLVSFLARVESDISSLLLQNIKSTAFHGYNVKWEDEIDSVSCLATFNHPHKLPGLSCTDLSWNKAGSVIATSHGRLDHTSWCAHKGMISLWSMSYRNHGFDACTFTAETSSCLMSVAFHPDIPSIIAGGAFNGEITVWSTTDPQNPIIALSSSTALAHQEPIAKVVWIPSSTKHGQFDLMSVGNDGKILIWDLDNKLSKPKAISQIMLSNISSRIRQTTVKSRLDSPVGITSISVSTHNTQDYLIGTESGHVLKCTLANVTQILPKQEVKGSLPNVVSLAYMSHVGPVQSISQSAFHRNVFITCGSDGTIRLYNQLQPKPIMAWEPSEQPICSAQWSPFRSAVFACTTQEGNIHFYDLTVSQSTPAVTIKATESTVKIAPVGLFNPIRPEYFASGDAEGVLKIWQLSTLLTHGGDIDDDTLIKHLAQS
ncbi:WD repeat-containing protein 34 [Batrachochytrium dendrobatidis]|nr:WD repeat-containing protein 34 [Batrachochytrium dendrobatidis]